MRRTLDQEADDIASAVAIILLFGVVLLACSAFA